MYHLCHIDEKSRYMYYFSESKDMGFVVKLHKEEGKDQ
jgi:hypothetical protein